jgi:prophage regulatory protein
MKFLRIGQVMQLTGLSRMTIYRLELAGEFPKRPQLSKDSVAWLDTDIAQWAASRPVSRLRGAAGRAAALGWCGLRLNHPISGNLVRDRASPQLAGGAQGYAVNENPLRALRRDAGFRHQCHGNPRAGTSAGPCSSTKGRVFAS